MQFIKYQQLLSAMYNKINVDNDKNEIKKNQ